MDSQKTSSSQEIYRQMLKENKKPNDDYLKSGKIQLSLKAKRDFLNCKMKTANRVSFDAKNEKIENLLELISELNPVWAITSPEISALILGKEHPMITGLDYIAKEDNCAIYQDILFPTNLIMLGFNDDPFEADPVKNIIIKIVI